MQPIAATVNAVDISFMADNAASRRDPVEMYEYDYKYYTGVKNPETEGKRDYSKWNNLLNGAGY